MNEIEKAINCLSTFIKTLEHYETQEEETKAMKIAVQALQEKLERVNPQLLGLEELKNMDGEPVWIEVIGKPDLNCWGYHDEDGVNGYTCFTSDEDYGKTWLAYRYEPKGV